MCPPQEKWLKRENSLLKTYVIHSGWLGQRVSRYRQRTSLVSLKWTQYPTGRRPVPTTKYLYLSNCYNTDILRLKRPFFRDRLV